MADKVKIRRIRAEDWSFFRNLRLEALRSDPLAFGSTFEREEALPDEFWKGRSGLPVGGGDEIVLLAEAADGRLLGMAGVFTDKDRVYQVWGMWVAPSDRGQGIAGNFLDEIIAWAHVSNPSRPLCLAVNPDQRAAVRLYSSRDFQSTGRTQPLGHHPPSICVEMRRRTT
jgi:GNAT superfamily N-acetyltransferase